MESTPNELTPEERLFKIIQEGEKSPADETLTVSSDKVSETPLADPFFETISTEQVLKSPADNLSVNEIHAKKAVRANAAVRRLLKDGALHGMVSLQTANRALIATLGILLISFVSGQVFFRDSPGLEFMKKANAMGAPAIDAPSNLFDVQVSAETFPPRNVFRPWKAPDPAAAGSGDTATTLMPGALSGVISNLKLSGIYLSEIPEALIEAVDEKKTYSVRKGSEIRGLKVKEVKEDGVILTDGRVDQLLQ